MSLPALSRVNSSKSEIVLSPDPFQQGSGRRLTLKAMWNAVTATALFRVWPALVFLAGWGAMVVLVQTKAWDGFRLPSTVLTVLGTVIGFVISFRATTATERYSEGRRYWQVVIQATRLFSRTLWLHVPDATVPPPDKDVEVKPSPEEVERDSVKALIEKRSVMNLLLAYAVSLKHYLRQEEGIYYEDLYPLMSYLPRYSLPSGLPRNFQRTEEESDHEDYEPPATPISPEHPGRQEPQETTETTTTSFSTLTTSPSKTLLRDTPSPEIPMMPMKGKETHEHGLHFSPPPSFELLPARLPPKDGFFDVFPGSMLRFLFKRASRSVGLDDKRKGMQSKKARRKELQRRIVNHNIPLEITFYLSSYVSALQQRKVADVTTVNNLYNSINSYQEALAGLERILTTPIPWTYSVHIWTVTWIYVLLLPFQIVETFKWVTIPMTALVGFVLLGLLSIGEEIEDPFGYDDNDLPMDFFIREILSKELMALTSTKAPKPSKWAFHPANLPFGDFDPRSARELARTASPKELYRLMRKQAHVSAEETEHVQKLRKRKPDPLGRGPSAKEEV